MRFQTISGNRSRRFVPGGTKGKRGPRTDNRLFLDALLWMARSGGLARPAGTAWRLRFRNSNRLWPAF